MMSMGNIPQEYINDRDFDGPFDEWQRRLDEAGVDYDITNLAGATFAEIEGFVRRMEAMYSSAQPVIS
jgi:hypothetical protein